MRLLEGAIMSPEDEPLENNELREEIRELQNQLREARRETAAAKRAGAQALSNLQKLLKPWYQALKMIYGELDAAGMDEAPAASVSNSRTAAVWQAWKDRVGGQPAKLIDAFLLHGEMTSGQIAVAIQISPKNVAQVVHKLNKLSLIQKNGDKFSLKKL